MRMRSAPAAARAVRTPVIRTAVAAGVTALLAAMLAGGALAQTTGQKVQAVLNGVSCEGPSFCLAVGDYTGPGHSDLRLAEVWNGKKWQFARDALRGDLIHLTCASPSLCFAIDTSFTVDGNLVRWNGRTWQKLHEQPADAVDLTCGSPTTCMTFDGNHIERWTGSGWRDLSSGDFCDNGPPPGTTCGWYTITCGSSTICLALGYACDSTECFGGPGLFVLAWNGISWGDGSIGVYPGSIACAGRAFCMNTAGPFSAEVLENGWKSVNPDLAAICHNVANCNLNGVLACGAAQHCVVIPPNSPVSLVWNGTTWRTAQLAKVDGQLPQLSAVSCGSAYSCMAVGSYGHSPLTIAEHWNGSKWRVSWTLNS